MGVLTIEGSFGWAMFGSSYVPGALQPKGSPDPAVLKMRNCGLVTVLGAAPPSPSANALRGLSKTEAGMPVASARRPTKPVPKTMLSKARRRSSVMTGASLSDAHHPRGEAGKREDRLESNRRRRAGAGCGRVVAGQDADGHAVAARIQAHEIVDHVRDRARDRRWRRARKERGAAAAHVYDLVGQESADLLCAASIERVGVVDVQRRHGSTAVAVARQVGGDVRDRRAG